MWPRRQLGLPIHRPQPLIDLARGGPVRGLVLQQRRPERFGRGLLQHNVGLDGAQLLLQRQHVAIEAELALLHSESKGQGLNAAAAAGDVDKLRSLAKINGVNTVC